MGKGVHHRNDHRPLDKRFTLLHTGSGGFFKKFWGGAKLNLSELFYYFIIEYYSTHTRTTIRWVYLSNSIFFCDLMTISLNRDIVKAINLDNVLERWMMRFHAS